MFGPPLGAGSQPKTGSLHPAGRPYSSPSTPLSGDMVNVGPTITTASPACQGAGGGRALAGHHFDKLRVAGPLVGRSTKSSVKPGRVQSRRA